MATVNTPKGRVSYPNVFKPRKNELNGKTEYSLTLLFPKGTDLSKLEAAIEAAKVKKWGADKSRWPKMIRTPLREQGDKEKNVDGRMVMPPGYEKGAFYVNLKSERKPNLVDAQVQDILDESEFYAGCFARASISVYAYDQAGNRGVAFGLSNIQKMADGDPLGGRTRPEDDFTAIEGAGSESGSDLFG